MRSAMPWIPSLIVLALAAGTHAAPAPTPDLPASDVVRLSEQARALFDEGKLHAWSDASRLAPVSIQAESLHSYDAIHYRLDVTLSRVSNLVSGTMTLDLQVVDPSITQIDLFDQGLTVTAARVNGVARTSSVASGKLLVPVCEGADCPPHGAGDPLQVAVDYSASPAHIGFYFYPRNSYTFTEPFDARYWMPCYDLPNDKATLDVYCTAPDSNVCVSNGVLLSVTPGPAGTKVYHWQETHPLATYLMAVTVGSFWQWTQMSGSIPILQNVFPEDSTKAKFDFANIPTMIPTFAARWGPYAFDKYGQVAVTPFGAGGMEHQSLTTINRSWVRGDRGLEDGMSHELAHQWWGDMVTLVDFRDIWLNEGFASYGECEWQEDFYGAAAYDAYVQSQMTSALNSDNNIRYALYNPPAANLFGNTIYMKGSLVLHMLRRVLGDPAFFAGMQLYGQRYRYGNATTRDFQHAMEDASGQPLAWYFDEWVFDKGLPTYNWTWQSAPAGPGRRTVAVTIRQNQTNAPYFRMPIEFKVQRGGGLPDTSVTVTNNAVAIETLTFDVEGASVTNVVFDPRNSIYKRISQSTVGVPEPVPGPSVSMSVGPVPARSSVAVSVRLSSSPDAPIEVTIYDGAGRAIRTLGAARAGAGSARFEWDLRDGSGRAVPNGLYFVQARAGSSHEERPIVVTR